MENKKIIKDKKKREKFKKYELKRIVWLCLKKNEFLPYQIRNLGSYELHVNKIYFVNIRNFCIISGRSRGIVKEFRISRMFFKQFANFGLLEGIRKSSW